MDNTGEFMFTNQKGMSLVSVLMAIGLTGVLSVILMNLMEQQGKQQKKALIDGETSEIFGQFVRIINQKTSCGATFTGLQKGDTLLEFRYSFDANQEPFAEVGKNFRGTKLILSAMKILTDAEVLTRNMTPLGKDPQGFTTVVLEVTLDRPDGTLGGKSIKKIFDVPVAMGRGTIMKMSDPNAISSACTAATSDGCITDFDTGLCPANPQDAMIDAATYWFAYCFDPTPASPADDVIIRCTATN
jgi:hypothetical protein